MDSFFDAARRHRYDAKHLAAGRRFQNAGHLIGFAAECLAKQILEGAGISIDQNPSFKVHFPNLRDRIRTDGRSRVMMLLAPIPSSPDLLGGWRAECRYEAAILETEAKTRYDLWSADVEALFSAAGVP